MTTARLHALCHDERLDLAAVEEAVRAGADLSATLWSPNIVFNAEMTPLLALMMFREPAPTPELVHLLVDHGADVCWASERGYTALHLAAAHHHLEVVRTLLELGADPNAVCATADVVTPLHACIHPSAELCLPVVELLLAHGAEVDVPNHVGQTALFRALDRRNLPVLERLVAAGGDLNVPWEGGLFGFTAFGYAVAHRRELVEWLVDLGADPDAPQRGGQSCLWRPIFEGDQELVRRLVALGTTIDRPDDAGRTVLAHYVAYPVRCEPEMVRLLLELGADPDHADLQGRTALHEAVSRQEVETLEVLLAHGADPDRPDAEGLSPRQHARSPLVLAALGATPSLDRDDVTGLALALLRDGLVFTHGDWSIARHGDDLVERRASRWHRRRSVSEVHVEEVLGHELLGDGPARASLLRFLDEGLSRAGQRPLGTDEVRERLAEARPELVARLRLAVHPWHAGEVIAEALAAGLVLSKGDKEGWSRWSAVPGGGFLYEAGSHFGPEGEAHDTYDRRALVALWGRRFEVQRGRLEGWQRADLDRALEHLGQPSVRRWLVSRPGDASQHLPAG